MQDVEVLKLLSVTLSREKQDILQEELRKYSAATNWTIKQILKLRLSSRSKTFEALQDEFAERYDKRRGYLEDVVKTASVEIAQHRRLVKSIRSMRDKTPFFKPGRLILSQPLIQLDEKAIRLVLHDKSILPIPFDKRSRNRLAGKIAAILREGKEAEKNRNYDRIRVTWNKEGFADIDIRAVKQDVPD